jgi:hypothetical protein
MSNHKTKLHFVEGDTVLVELEHYPPTSNDRSFEAVVVSIRERPGRVNGGTTPEGALVVLNRVDTGEEVQVHEDFIRRVTAIGPRVRRPHNIYAERRPPACMFRAPHKGQWVGAIHELVAYVLGSMHIQATQPLHPERIRSLFIKSRAGLLWEDGPLFVRVRRKPFVAWVKRNWRRLLQTRREWGEGRTEINRLHEDNYYRSLEREWEQEWDAEDLAWDNDGAGEVDVSSTAW